MVAFAEPRAARASRRGTPAVFRRRAIPGRRFSGPRKVMLILTYFEHGAHGLVTKIKPLGGTEVNFAYDALLRRTRMTQGAVTTYFRHDGLDLLEIADTSGNLTKLTHGYKVIDGIGSVVEIEKNGTRYYLHQDHRGTTYKITDANGDVVWTGFWAFPGTVYQFCRPLPPPSWLPTPEPSPLEHLPQIVGQIQVLEGVALRGG